MPFIKVSMWAGRDEAAKEKLIQNITKATCDAINCPPEAVWIAIDDVPKTNWGMGGKQASKA